MFNQLYQVRTFLFSLHGAIRSLLQSIGVLFGLIPKSGRFSSTVYWCIHYAFIITIILVLGRYSSQLIPEARVPISNWFVQRYYVAIQFVLFYMFLRLLIAGVELFLAKDLSEFQDIDQAWEAGLDALAREGYDLQWLPVFLVNGVSSDHRKSLFESTKLQWKVSGGSEDPRASALSFYACDEAVFICLNDVGAMSMQLHETAVAPAAVAAGGGSSSYAGQQTLKPGALQAAVEQTRRPEAIQAAAGKTLPPNAAANIGKTMAPPRGGYAGTIRPGELAEAVSANTMAPQKKNLVQQKLSQSNLNLSRRRMEHLCQKLLVERGSYCPINGLLQVIPLRWSQTAALEPLFDAAEQDLHTMHRSLHMQFPVVLLHSGLEEIVGLSHFIERGRELDSRFRDSRAGSRYPAGLEIDEQTSTWIVDRGLLWFRDWVYAEFAKNLASPQNRQLYQFLCALSARRARLSRELTTIIGNSIPIRLTGCYFAAMGVDSSKQAFIQGVVERLMSEQNDVAWLPSWRRRDSRLMFLTFIIFLLCLAVLGADAYLAWKIWERASLIAAG